MSLTEVSLAEGKFAGLSQQGSSPYRLLCVHGWLDNAASFVPLLQAMPEQDAIAVDWAGHGKSKPRGAYYHFIDYVDDLLQIVKALPNDKPLILVGHSLGALVSSVFASSFSELISACVFIDGLGPLSQGTEEQSAWIRKAIESRHRPVKQRKLESLAQATQLRQLNSQLEPQHCELLAARDLQPLAEGGYQWRHDPKLTCLSPLRMTQEQAERVCRDIKLTCLLLLSESQSIISQAQLAQRQAWFSQLEIERIDGSHHLHMDQAECCAQLIQNYIQTIV